MSISFLESNKDKYRQPKRIRSVLVDEVCTGNESKRNRSGSAPISRLETDRYKMKLPAKQRTAKDLRSVLEALAKTAAEEVDATRSRKAHKHHKEPSSAVALYNAEAQANAKPMGRKGPYNATAEVLRGMLTPTPKGSLSTDAIPHQYALLQACLATRELFDVPHERVGELAKLLDEAAKLAKELFDELTHDWKRDLESTLDGYQPVQGAVEADVWKWDPSKLTYRALSVRNGKHVGSFVKDFIGAFVRRERSASESVLREDVQCDHPYLKRQLDEMLRERDGAMKRGGSQITGGGKQHRHPCVGPLAFEDYLLHEADIVSVVDAHDDAAEAEARLQDAFPATSISDICTQHKFRLRFDRLCESMCHAVEYIGSNGIFGEPILLHGLFCLTVMQSNKGEKFDEVNSKETWFLRFFNRLVTWHEPQLQAKNYKPQQECASAKSHERRHANNLDADTVVLQMEGRIGGWVQAEFIKELTTYYLERRRAFERAKLIEKISREDHLSKLGISKNSTDNFDDLIQSRPTTPRAAKETGSTSWNTPGSQAEESNLKRDAITLAIVVVGREQAMKEFPELVKEAGIELLREDATGTAQGGSLAIRNAEAAPRERTPEEVLRRLEDAEDAMPWLALRQRCDKSTLLQRIRIELQRLGATLNHVKRAVKITKLVDAEYKSIREQWQADRLRILHLPDTQILSAKDRMRRDKDEATEMSEALAEAVEAVFGKTACRDPMCTSKETVEALVGKPPAWNWDIHAGDEAVVPNSQHASLVQDAERLFRKYEEYVAGCNDATTMVDLASPLRAILDQLLEPKEAKTAEEEFDWVGFGQPLSRVRDSYKGIEGATVKIMAMREYPNDFLKVLADVVHGGFLLALDWAGVFSQHAQRAPCHKTPHLGLGICHVLKVLSVAAAHDAIDIGASNAPVEPPPVFTTADGRIDISDPDDIVRFAKASNSNWRCLCTLASLTKALLVYNRNISFDADAATDKSLEGLVSVSFSQSSFLVVHADAVQAHRRDLDAYHASLCPEIPNFPTRHDWGFHDEHWNHPDAFTVLLTWLPDAAHEKEGFFVIPGVRDRPDKNNGFLNVSKTLRASVNPDARQYWNNVCTHPLAATHGRLPPPLPISSGEEDDPGI